MDRIEKILVFVVVATIVVIVTLALSNSGDDESDDFTVAQLPNTRSEPQANGPNSGAIVPPVQPGEQDGPKGADNTSVTLDPRNPVHSEPRPDDPGNGPAGDAGKTGTDKPGSENKPSVPSKPAKPADEGATPRTPAKPAWNNWYTVVKNDNLWTISEKVYGHGKYWTVIRDANLDVDPDHLKVGEKLNTPYRKSPVRAVQPTTLVMSGSKAAYRHVTIRKGEWIYSVLRRENLESRYNEILALNGLDADSAGDIQPGFRLKLPTN